MSKEKKGKGCLICMNILLLILGALVIGATIYVMNGTDVPPIFKALEANCYWLIVAGVILIIFSIFGICASCGGCVLYFYSIFITLLTIVFLVVDIIFFVAYFTINPNKPDNQIVSVIDNLTLTVIQDPEAADDWKTIQDSFNCCGYNNIETTKTGSACIPESLAASPEPVSDCRALLFDVCEKYSLYASLIGLVIFLVLLILTCASCKRWKDDDCCSCC